ncbi:hypothetical protein JXO59_02790, partial [candidate division KSB1 bacterium]|nr:hypothetical protein [candidate division KSB1 bacterium]
MISIKKYPSHLSLFFIILSLLPSLLAAQTLPDPPQLIAPEDGAKIEVLNPAFFWTSAMKIPGRQKLYALTIVRLMPGQTAKDAIRSNKPHHQVTLGRTSYEYPPDAWPLENGLAYAWQVQAIDEKGRLIAANSGYTEIFTFSIAGPLPTDEPLHITTGTLTMTGLGAQEYLKRITTGTLTMTGLG